MTAQELFERAEAGEVQGAELREALVEQRIMAPRLAAAIAADLTQGAQRKDFDPRQPRDPHTGEWIEAPGGNWGDLIADYNLSATERRALARKVRAAANEEEARRVVFDRFPDMRAADQRDLARAIRQQAKPDKQKEAPGGEVSADEFWQTYDQLKELLDPRTDLTEVRTTEGHRITVDPEHPSEMKPVWGGGERVDSGLLLVEYPDMESWRKVQSPNTIIERALEGVEVRDDGTIVEKFFNTKRAAEAVAQQRPGQAIRVPIDRVEEHGDMRPIGRGHVGATTEFSPGTVYNGEWIRPGKPVARIKRNRKRDAVEDAFITGQTPAYRLEDETLTPATPLYHVSANLPVARDDGYLTVGKGGGLGAFGEEESVSFTLDGDAAKVIVGDMKRHIRLAKALPPEPEPGESVPGMPPRGTSLEEWNRRIEAAREVHREWSRKIAALLEKEAQDEGWEYKPESSTVALDGWSYRDWLNDYYGKRPAVKGGNPIYIGLYQEDQRQRDEANIGVIQLRLGEAEKLKALMTYLWSEDEVRVYADVPIKKAKVIAGG